jgi:hypothetical protein
VAELCSTKLLLVKQWQIATAAYSHRVRQLSCHIGKPSTESYSTLKRDAEAARFRCLEAQANLDAHISSHGCEWTRETAA